MGLGPEAVVVLHVGGAAGGFDAAMDRFVAGFEQLSERARARLVIENDDRTFGLCHVLELHERTGSKVVWDILHHHCNDPDGIPDREALELRAGHLARRCDAEDPLLLAQDRDGGESAGARAAASNGPGCSPSCAPTPT